MLLSSHTNDVVVGIDPGKEGAFAFLAADGSLVAIHEMPCVTVLVNKKPRPRVTPAGIASLLRQYNISHVFLERVGSMQGEGAAGAFAFGVSCGQIEGSVATLGIPYTLITPQSWRRSVGIPSGSNTTLRKEAAVQRAIQLWPSHSDKFMRINRKGRSVGIDGVADAALIAYAGMTRNLRGDAQIKTKRRKPQIDSSPRTLDSIESDLALD